MKLIIELLLFLSPFCLFSQDFFPMDGRYAVYATRGQVGAHYGESIMAKEISSPFIRNDSVLVNIKQYWYSDSLSAFEERPALDKTYWMADSDSGYLTYYPDIFCDTNRPQNCYYDNRNKHYHIFRNFSLFRDSLTNSPDTVSLPLMPFLRDTMYARYQMYYPELDSFYWLFHQAGLIAYDSTITFIARGDPFGISIIGYKENIGVVYYFNEFHPFDFYEMEEWALIRIAYDIPLQICSHDFRKDIRILRVSPNPFNPSTRISYNLSPNRTGTLQIFDIRGKMVFERPIQGSGTVTWDASGLGSGVYVLKALSGGKTYSRKLILQR